MRTDDVALRIEYFLGVKWTPDQYRKICGILRDYRHHSIMTIIDRASDEPDSNNPGVRTDE